MSKRRCLLFVFCPNADVSFLILSHHTCYHTVTLHTTQVFSVYVSVALLRLVVAVAVCTMYCSQRSKRYNKNVSRKLHKLRLGVNPAIAELMPQLTAVPLWLQQVCQTLPSHTTTTAI
jgi:hypothetical protein